MAHAADLDKIPASDLLAGITRRIDFLKTLPMVDTSIVGHHLAEDLPGLAEAYALLTDLTTKIKGGEL